MKEMIETFCDQCVKLKIIYNEYVYLYESSKQRLKLFEEVAINFFHDLQGILIEYLILSICKLTDPPHFRNDDNLTVKYILENIAPDVIQSLGLNILSDKIHVFRDYIISARNKIIAHPDKETLLTQKTLGAFPEDEIKKFWDALQEFVNKVHEHYLGGIMPLDAFNPKGANDVVEALKKAVHYDEYFNDKLGLKLEAQKKMRFKDA
jgi:hypothetical protein